MASNNQSVCFLPLHAGHVATTPSLTMYVSSPVFRVGKVPDACYVMFWENCMQGEEAIWLAAGEIVGVTWSVPKSRDPPSHVTPLV